MRPQTISSEKDHRGLTRRKHWRPGTEPGTNSSWGVFIGRRAGLNYYETLDQMRVPSCHQEAHEAAEGLANENNSLRIHSVSPTHHVFDKIREAHARRVSRTSTVTAHVQCDYPVGGAKRFRSVVPLTRVAEKAVKKDHRWPAPRVLVAGEMDAVAAKTQPFAVAHSRHRVIAGVERGRRLPPGERGTI